MKKMVLFGGLGVLLAAGGGGAYFFLMGGEPEVQSEVAKVEPYRQPVYIEIKPLTAPVVRNNRVRYYVNFGISLQLYEESDKDLIYQNMPRLRDAFLRELHSRSLPMDDATQVIDFAGLKSRLRRQANKVLGEGKIQDVLVTRALGG